MLIKYKINKVDKHVVKITKKKRTQITNIISENGTIATDFMGSKRIIK